MPEQTASPQQPDQPMDSGDVPSRTETIATELTAEELAEAKRYGRADLICMLTDKALDVAYLAVAAFLLAQPLDEWLGQFALLDRFWTLRLAVLFLVVFALHVAVSFPLTAYSGHFLERQYALSNQTFRRWFWQYAKQLCLAFAFGLALWIGLFWLIWLTGAYWWLVAAGAFFLVSVVLGQLAPVLIMPLFYKFEKLDEPQLADRISRLAEEANLSIEGVYRMLLSEETVKANAALAGMGRTRRVLLGDTLLDRFTPDEIEIVFAHEVGHHAHRHIRKMLITGIFSSAAVFWVCHLVLTGWLTRQAGAVDYGLMPIYTLPLLMLIVILLQTLLEPLRNAMTRHFERQADRYALQKTGLREAFISAFRKLARINKDDPDPHWLDAFLFHGHPPIGQRVAMAERASAATPSDGQ